mmetsp:Transcript_33404/g.99488  ORF Transcript_33404/g.99488 Transcript_33404/m.99488 type:complete len:205 (+) Transcript_33404:34-648(+)
MSAGAWSATIACSADIFVTELAATCFSNTRSHSASASGRSRISDTHTESASAWRPSRSSIRARTSSIGRDSGSLDNTYCGSIYGLEYARSRSRRYRSGRRRCPPERPCPPPMCPDATDAAPASAPSSCGCCAQGFAAASSASPPACVARPWRPAEPLMELTESTSGKSFPGISIGRMSASAPFCASSGSTGPSPSRHSFSISCR